MFISVTKVILKPTDLFQDLLDACATEADRTALYAKYPVEEGTEETDIAKYHQLSCKIPTILNINSIESIQPCYFPIAGNDFATIIVLNRGDFVLCTEQFLELSTKLLNAGLTFAN